MNLENNIKDIISKKLEDGIIEEIISKEFEKGVTNALGNLFQSYGDITKVIENKVKSVMVPYIEKYDYSEYITKLDSVLVEVLKNTAMPNKKILENFKSILVADEAIKEIKVTDMFDAWKEYVEENIDTSGLEVNHDDEPSYEYVEVKMEFEEDNEYGWSKNKYGTLIFECEHDEDMNFYIKLRKWHDEDKWEFFEQRKNDISSLRYINSFEIFLMQLNEMGTKVEIDRTFDTDDVCSDKEPEAEWI